MRTRHHSSSVTSNRAGTQQAATRVATTVENRADQQTSSQAPAIILANPKGRSIEFTLDRPGAVAVAVAGTFNNWDTRKHPLRKEPGANWKATVALPAGRHEYRFVVDGEWLSDPKAKEQVGNPFGGTNSVIVI